MKPEPGLYWSESGAITCQDHAPRVGTDTWLWGRWKRLSHGEAQLLEASTPGLAQCESCGRTIEQIEAAATSEFDGTMRRRAESYGIRERGWE